MKFLYRINGGQVLDVSTDNNAYAGVNGFLTTVIDEVAVRTLPLFLANVLGVRIGIFGLIEGIAESTATLLKLASGYLADRFGRKKALVLGATVFPI
jgi:MFS family permease